MTVAQTEAINLGSSCDTLKCFLQLSRCAKFYHKLLYSPETASHVTLKGVSARRKCFRVLVKDTLTGMDTWISKVLPCHFNDDMDLPDCAWPLTFPWRCGKITTAAVKKRRRCIEFLFAWRCLIGINSVWALWHLLCYFKLRRANKSAKICVPAELDWI